ncbi:MAG TPA: TMEM165/GDT1 family protein [Vicinamibacterales bacterium]|nr:TMEM165/GDT1 family protein [Vicinamibacterales bacterium]
MLAIVFATYATVFLAEIVGDKLLYTTGVLATRYRWGAVVAGMAMAFAAKMAAAVAIGAAIATLLVNYRWVVALVTAASFVFLAMTLWRKSDVRAPKEKDARILQGSMVAFATIFFSEWFDVGMQAAGTMAVTFVWSANRPADVSQTTAAVLVWLGAVGAMVTKGALAVAFGASVRNWIAARVAPRVVRYAAVATIVVIGTLAVLETLGLIVD